jgi:peptidoglycan/LPS O-acetylase OafA/YrhL
LLLSKPISYNQNFQERTYYPLLSGLRGIAILLVVFYHNFGFFNYFFFGWVGVDLFFVLSGFLITSILIADRDKKNYFRNFFLKRLLRIFPVYYLTLFIILFVIPALAPGAISTSIDYYKQNQLYIWFYLQNWLFIFKQPPDNLLSHLWSLAVEEQYYFLWPFLLFLIKDLKKLFYIMLSLLLLVIFLRFIIWTFKIEELAYFNLYTFSRIDGICIGSMLALIRINSQNFFEKYTPFIILSLAALNFLFFFFNREMEFSFPYLAIVGYTTFAILFGLLVNEAITTKNRILHFILGNRILNFFGYISYGLYIFHWPIYVLLRTETENWGSKYVNNISPQIFASISLTLLAIIMAYLSYKFFEAPFLKMKKYLN